MFIRRAQAWMTWRAGGELGLVGDQQGGLVVAQAGDGELPDRAGAGRRVAAGSSCTLTRRVRPASAARVMEVQADAGR